LQAKISANAKKNLFEKKSDAVHSPEKEHLKKAGMHTQGERHTNVYD